MIEAIYVIKGHVSSMYLEQFSTVITKHYKPGEVLICNLADDNELLVYGNGPQPTELKGKGLLECTLGLIDVLPYAEQHKIYKALYAKNHRI
jgi:hypothetical protein